MIKQYAVQNNYTLWRIDRTRLGNFTFKCKVSENTNAVLSVPSSSNVSGTNLQQAAYTDDEIYMDEWILYKIQYIAHVYNYYDTGYSVRYNETANESATQINGYNNLIAEQYLKLLGLSIMPTSAQYYQSPIDICKGTTTTDNINTTCTHSGTVHTNRSSVISNFNSTYIGNSITTYILWSCHRITSTATNGTPNYNRSCTSGTGIFMLEICNTQNRTINSSGVLMHELSHQYGAPDHYHELADKNDEESCKFKDICSQCGENPRPANCIMNNPRVDISNSNIICIDCIQEIIGHLNGHHNLQ